MNCCIDCFCDSQIRTIIDSFGQEGDCDFCGKKKTKIYPISENGAVEELLNSILDIYDIEQPSINGKPLNVALYEDWSIFSVTSDVIQKLITSLCKTYFEQNANLLLNPVIIPECYDEDYLSDFSVTRGKSWREFSETVKYQNRFYNSIFNTDALASFLSYSVKLYPADSIMYRARISKDREGFKCDEMGAPPRENRSAGRVNPEGVGVLYLSSESETALYEVRSNIYDYVSIGEFKLLRDIRVVNLAGIKSVSPFIYTGKSNLQQYAINQPCLKEIAEDIAKPLRRNDSLLEYIPTQIISEFIKSQAYDGVEYVSTMTKNGRNCAIFDDSLFSCVNTYVYEIEELIYKPQRL